jgi:hypothetical protein
MAEKRDEHVTGRDSNAVTVDRNRDRDARARDAQARDTKSAARNQAAANTDKPEKAREPLTDEELDKLYQEGRGENHLEGLRRVRDAALGLPLKVMTFGYTGRERRVNAVKDNPGRRSGETAARVTALENGYVKQDPDR